MTYIEGGMTYIEGELATALQTYIEGELALLPLPDGRVHTEHHPVRVLALHEVVVPDDEGDQVRRHDRRPLVSDHAAVRVLVSSVTLHRLKVYRKEGSVLFNDTLNTFYSEHSFSLSLNCPRSKLTITMYTHLSRYTY